jgi:hypothetical protein
MATAYKGDFSPEDFGLGDDDDEEDALLLPSQSAAAGARSPSSPTLSSTPMPPQVVVDGSPVPPVTSNSTPQSRHKPQLDYFQYGLRHDHDMQSAIRRTLLCPSSVLFHLSTVRPMYAINVYTVPGLSVLLLSLMCLASYWFGWSFLWMPLLVVLLPHQVRWDTYIV